MKSLLKKAQELRQAVGSELAASGNFVFDQASGISKEDQKDILLHIDRVAKSSRILSGPDTWKVRPRKRGLALPILVNLAGVAVLAAGLFTLTRIFAPRADTVESSSVLLSSAEGRLLQEIKRESEGLILEKDREIASIQERMASLDKEKDQLAASVETRIKAKEKELEDQLRLELDKERQRLQAEGLSETAIQERLREFERLKTEEFRSQLDGFAKKAEEERLALQGNLDKARAEYMKTLSDATAERQRIQDESRAREQALRAQLDDKNAALEAERARAADTLRSAQAELTKLNESAARAKASESQLLGLYAAARQSLREGRVEDASKTLVSLRAYLNEPQVAALPALQERRELDLFAMDLIDRTIAAERAKASVDTSRLTAALDALTVVRNETERARAAASAGKREEAAAAYRKALGATRELEEAGAFLEGEWQARLEAQTAAVEKAAAAAEKTLADSKAAVAALESAAKDTQALEAAFSRLLGNLPLGPGDATRIFGYVQDAGAREADAARRSADTAGAAAPFQSAAAEFAAERFADAIRGYASMLTRFPAAGQAPQALDGIVKSGNRLSAALRESRDNAAERVAALEARLAESSARATGLQVDLASSESDAATLRERVAALESAAAATPVPAAPAATATPGAGVPGGPTSAEYLALQEEKAGIESQLAEARARYQAVNAAYLAYAADEDAILARGGELALVEARARLDAFLSSPEVSEALPGMRDRIAAYLSSFQAAGQKEILFNAADIVDGAARIRDAAVRVRYFTDLEKRYERDPAMLEFLISVRESLK